MKKKKLNIVFMGTSLCACPFLEHIIKNEKLLAVFTAPDEHAGRHMKIQLPPVKKISLDHECKVIQAHNLKNIEVIQSVKDLNPDLLIVISYGYKIPSEILEIPGLGSINIHFSLLPKYRGAAPVNWALANGEIETGVTSFFLNDKMDSGDIICQKKININNEDNAVTLMDKLVILGVDVLKETIELIKSGKILAKSQDLNKVTHAPKLRKKDGLINWNETNIEIVNRIRAFYPWPGSYTYIKDHDSLVLTKLFDPEIEENGACAGKQGEILDISREKGMQVCCGRGLIWIGEMQLAAHKRMKPYDLYIGRKIKKGDIFVTNKY
ncbi:methionyl-tRNA formyltransferase [bacterium]